MTQTTPQVNKNLLSPEGQKLFFVILNIVYDEKSVEMLQQALQNTKTTEAITPQVALAAATVLHKMQDRLDQLPEEEVWGKGGIVHLCLDAIFEVAKVLGYKAPISELKKAYEIVDDILEQQKGQPEQPEGQEPGQEMQPQQPAPQGNMMQQAAMMGGQ